MKNIILLAFMVVCGYAHAQSESVDSATMAFADKYYYAVTGERLQIDFLNEEEIALVRSVLTDANTKSVLTEKFIDHDGFVDIRLANFVSRLTNETAEPYEEIDDFQVAIASTILNGSDFRDIFSKPFFISRKGDSNVVSNRTIRDSVQDQELKAVASNFQLNFDVEQMNGTVADGYMYDGIFSSQGFGRRFIMGGTNRRPIRGVYDIFLCAKIESIKDASLSDKFIGQDIARNPGNNPHEFQVKCSACHAVLDSQRGAFAHYHFYDMDSGLQKLVDIDAERYNRNQQNNPDGDGYETTDDYWENPLDSEESQQRFGWRTELNEEKKIAGNDVLSFSTMVANSEQFQRCMVQKLITEFCEKPAENIDRDDAEFIALYQSLRTANYNMKATISKIIQSKFCE
jgi:hypothetical protein